MLINTGDHKILRSFLEREVDQYLWTNDATREERKVSFFVKMWESIVGREGSYDYVHVHSITNIGSVDATLTLSCANWKQGKDAHFNLPPSPRGGVHFYEKEK